MSNMAIIEKRTGRRITLEDINTSQPQRTMELLVKMGRAIWEDDKIEVSPTDAISILEDERVRLIDEREVLEEEKRGWLAEVLSERKRMEEVRNSFEIEKKKFELERETYHENIQTENERYETQNRKTKSKK